MTYYRITWADGAGSEDYDTLEQIYETLAIRVGPGLIIGHSGDLDDGGERTLFWATGDDADSDDGTKAIGDIRAVAS